MRFCQAVLHESICSCREGGPPRRGESGSEMVEAARVPRLWGKVVVAPIITEWFFVARWAFHSAFGRSISWLVSVGCARWAR